MPQTSCAALHSHATRNRGQGRFSAWQNARMWPLLIMRVLVVLALNAVPIWGFTEEEWTPGTTLALYWFQGVVSIPITAVLIEFHRRATHKAGHYSGTTTKTIVGGGKVTTRSTFLNGFLWMSIPFVVAHGIFLAVLLGGIWRSAPGAVDFDDLRVGALALLNVMALGFAVDVFQIAQRPFAWIERRAESLMTRSMAIHLTILVGLGVAVFSDHDPTGFFRVFIFLKVLADLAIELPQWDPEVPPAWIVRMMNRIGGPGADFAADWKKTKQEERESAVANEQVDLLGLERRL